MCKEIIIFRLGPTISRKQSAKTKKKTMYYSRSFILNGTTDQDYDTVETSTFSGIKTPGNYGHGDISS